MAISRESEKALEENLDKCRCCFRLIIDDRNCIKISDDQRIQFFELCQIELYESELFADRICQLCSNDLKLFSNLRKDLISKQKDLYQLAGIDDFSVDKIVIKEVEVDETYEESEVGTYELDESQDTKYENELEMECLAEEGIEEHLQSELFSVDYIEEKSDWVKNEEKQSTNTETGAAFDFIEEIVESDTMDLKEDYENDKNSRILCEICDIEVSEHQLEEHIEVMHKNVSCSDCDENFQSEVLLNRHWIKKHCIDKNRSKRQHFCPLCSKEYEYRKQLDDHIRSFHEKERNSQCNICKKYFYHRDLKKHITNVHGEKKIKCDTCGKRYTCMENLRLHLRYHKPPSYACTFPDCDKKFHQKVLLQHHEKKHDGVKPFFCELCNARFHSERDLKRHCQRIHLKVVKQCMLCDVTFTRKDKFRRHLIDKHKELTQERRDDLLKEVREMIWQPEVEHEIKFKIK